MIKALGRMLNIGGKRGTPSSAAEPLETLQAGHRPDPDLQKADSLRVVPIWDRPPGWAMDNPEAYIDRTIPTRLYDTGFKPIQILPNIGLVDISKRF